jgi:hypothetical protein
MNCLEYALGFWKKNRMYQIYYNSDHVINLPAGSRAIGFLPIEEFGYEHMRDSFDLNDEAKETLKLYFNEA